MYCLIRARFTGRCRRNRRNSYQLSLAATTQVLLEKGAIVTRP